MALGIPNVKELMGKLEERFQQLVAELRVLGDKLDTLIEQGKAKAGGEGGGIPLAVIIVAVVVFVLIAGLFASCDALFDDEDERDDLGLPALVLDHECYEYGDCGYYDDGGYGRGGDGGDPGGHSGYAGGGGRSGDSEGEGSCRSFCNITVVPDPREEDRDRR